MLARFSEGYASRECQLAAGNDLELGVPGLCEVENVVPGADDKQVVTAAVNRV